MQDTRIAAFFDFDKTLLDTESSRIGIRYMWQRQMVSPGYILQVLFTNFFYERHWISDETMAAVLLKIYRRRRLVDFRQGAADFYHTCLKPRLAPCILDRLNWHRDQGHVTVLVSGSVRYMLEPVVADLGIKHLLCSELEQGPDGLLTGKADGRLCLGEHKRYLASELAADIGLELGASYAYGNHQSDLPLLELVGFPHAVEPTRPLRLVARENNWPILTYRSVPKLP